MLDLIRDIILATDLAHHLRIFKDLQKMADGQTQDDYYPHVFPLQLFISVTHSNCVVTEYQIFLILKNNFDEVI